MGNVSTSEQPDQRVKNTAEGHQWVFNTVRKSRPQSWTPAGLLTKTNSMINYYFNLLLFSRQKESIKSCTDM